MAAQDSWDTALHHGEKFGYKNSQVTVLAPTGTIGFMMDCDTTGIEPDLALVKHKKLVGGGLIKIVNNTVPEALMKLGYTPEQSSEIVTHIDKQGTVEGAPTPAPAALLEPLQRELFGRQQREKMPVERASVTHKFSVGGHEGYITAGMYEDGRPGEIFIKMSKEGSTLSGIMDGLALTISLGLQYGVPLKVFVDKLLNTRFEPSGITANPNIRFVSSVLDYIARWLGGRFISPDYLKLNGAIPAETVAASATALSAMNKAPLDAMQAALSASKLSNAHEGAPTCSECGMLMVPNGACYKCENCGSTSGCS